MHRVLRHWPSPAMVIACGALAVALGGTSYAAFSLPTNSVGTKQLRKNAITTPKIKNYAVTGAKIRLASLGKVPSAASADNASSATTALNANHATSADTAAPTGVAGGDLAGSYPNPTIAAPEAWQEVGADGQPPFEDGWRNDSPADETTAGFYKDPFGVIHLKGLITAGSNSTVFTLPAGYRPSKAFACLMWRSTSGTGELVIYPNGSVTANTGTGAADLDSVTFRANE